MNNNIGLKPRVALSNFIDEFVGTLILAPKLLVSKKLLDKKQFPVFW